MMILMLLLRKGFHTYQWYREFKQLQQKIYIYSVLKHHKKIIQKQISLEIDLIIKTILSVLL